MTQNDQLLQNDHSRESEMFYGIHHTPQPAATGRCPAPPIFGTPIRMAVPFETEPPSGMITQI